METAVKLVEGNVLITDWPEGNHSSTRALLSEKIITPNHDNDNAITFNWNTQNTVENENPSAVSNRIKVASFGKTMDTSFTCVHGGLWCHKFVTNDRYILESIPPRESVSTVKCMTLAFHNLPLERDLESKGIWKLSPHCHSQRSACKSLWHSVDGGLLIWTP